MPADFAMEPVSRKPRAAFAWRYHRSEASLRCRYAGEPIQLQVLLTDC